MSSSELPTSGMQYLYDRYDELKTWQEENYWKDIITMHSNAPLSAAFPMHQKRYEHFINARPELVCKYYPERNIASFLNMTEETLSRVRSARTKNRRKPVSGNQGIRLIARLTFSAEMDFIFCDRWLANMSGDLLQLVSSSYLFMKPAPPVIFHPDASAPHLQQYVRAFWHAKEFRCAHARRYGAPAARRLHP